MKDGLVVKRDDDGGDGRNSKIKTYLKKGIYTIEASTYSRNKTGKFILKIK
jgi:hypothetical protein